MHISKSQINSYLRCPFAYHCRYNMGLKIPPSSAMTLGTSFDHAVNVDYLEKIKSGTDAPVSVVTDAFASKFDEEKQNTLFQDDEKPDKIKDSAIPAVKTFYDFVCKKVNPEAVQISDEITFQNVGYTLHVVIDALSVEQTIIDNKLTRRAFTDSTSLLDAPIYSIWYYSKFGKLPAGFSYDVAIATKEPRAERHSVPVSMDLVEGGLRKIGMIKDSIEHDNARGCFFPNTRSFMCSRKNCGYWQICEREYKHTIKE